MTAEGPIPFTPEEEAEWDAMEASYVPPTQLAPTKEELLAKLQELQTQIQALG
jgi:hypothetical protein